MTPDTTINPDLTCYACQQSFDVCDLFQFRERRYCADCHRSLALETGDLTPPSREFTISNIAGGDERTFRLDSEGNLSGRAIKHARNIGYGGPAFGGPAGDRALAAWVREEMPGCTLDTSRADAIRYDHACGYGD